MLKLAIILLCIYSSPALFRYVPSYEGFYDHNNEITRPGTKYPGIHTEEVFASGTGSGDLWSIKLDNNLVSVKLRRANARQEKDFEDLVPKKVFLERLRQPSVQRNLSNGEDSRLTHDEVSALKEEIMRKTNKLGMYIRGKPDSYLADTIQEDSPSLQLYFHKDRRTLMVVSSVRQKWSYFNPFAPPTQFPDWLYQTHANTVQENDELYVRIPFVVKEQLYKTLEITLDKMLTVQ